MRRDEVVQPLIVIDEAMPMLAMDLLIKRLRLQSFVLRDEILVFSEKNGVFLRLCDFGHRLLRPQPFVASIQKPSLSIHTSR